MTCSKKPTNRQNFTYIENSNDRKGSTPNLVFGLENMMEQLISGNFFQSVSQGEDDKKTGKQ